MFEKLLERTAAALDSSAIPYMIIGGQAVLLYGEPRLTRDIDITLGIGAEEAGRVIDLAGKLDLEPLVPDPMDFISKTLVFPAMDRPSGIRLDFIFSYSSYENQAISRGNKIKLGEHYVNFASLEDVVIHKIIAARPRDIEDVKAILAKNPSYDERYIEKWLKDFDLALDEGFSSSFKEIRRDIS